MAVQSESGEALILRAYIKTLRRSAGLTQADVARRLNKPQSYVSKYESGERGLNILELRAICRALRVDFAAVAADLHKKLEQGHASER